MELVSVVIPSYNHANFIVKTLESVLNQTHKSIQLIIVDDGSTDDSEFVISQFLIKHHVENVLFLKQKNMGVSEAINTGILRSSGKYIFLLASDDIINPWAIKGMLEKFDRPEVGMVYGDASFIDAQSNSMSIPLTSSRSTKSFLEWRLQNAPFSPLKNLDVRRCLFDRNFIPPMIMLKKDVVIKVGMFDASLKLEDHEMWLRISRKYKIICFESIIGKYRIHGLNTILKSHRILFRDTISILLAEREHVKNTDDLFLLNKRILRLICSYVKNYKFSALMEDQVTKWLKEFCKHLT